MCWRNANSGLLPQGCPMHSPCPLRITGLPEGDLRNLRPFFPTRRFFPGRVCRVGRSRPFARRMASKKNDLAEGSSAQNRPQKKRSRRGISASRGVPVFWRAPAGSPRWGAPQVGCPQPGSSVTRAASAQGWAERSPARAWRHQPAGGPATARRRRSPRPCPCHGSG